MNLGSVFPLERRGTSVVTITRLVCTSLRLLQALPICHVLVNGAAHWSPGTRGAAVMETNRSRHKAPLVSAAARDASLLP